MIVEVYFVMNFTRFCTAFRANNHLDFTSINQVNYHFIFPFQSKVFEVNCSSQRSGCHVLSQLKEATQSHLVEMSGKDPLKPTYFNNYSSAPKSETLPGPGRTKTMKNGF